MEGILHDAGIWESIANTVLYNQVTNAEFNQYGWVRGLSWPKTSAEFVTRVADETDGLSNNIGCVEEDGRPNFYFMGKNVTSASYAGVLNQPITQDAWGWADTETPVFVDGSVPGQGGLTGVGNCTCLINCTNDSEVYAFHTGGANTLMGDGSVRFISANVSATTFGALCTMAQGEIVGDF